MQKVIINTTNGVELLHTINKTLKGTISDKFGEHVLNFDNLLGNGTIRSIDLDWGVTNLNYRIYLNQKISKIIQVTETTLVHFIFITKGNLFLRNNSSENEKRLQPLQNIIFAPTKNFNPNIEFPENTLIEFNVIYVNTNKFKGRKNNNLEYLNSKFSNFLNDKILEPFIHLGSYSLKIAELVSELNCNTNNSGMVKTLKTEGIILLVLAQQIFEYDNYENAVNLPDSLTSKDIETIHNLTKYIFKTISEPSTIETLCKESGLHPKKLQSGFQLLYSKTVNEYTRDLKLQIAHDLLKNTEKSISEIVFSIGFKSRSYFSKIFAEQYGLSPIEYRKNNKN